MSSNPNAEVPPLTYVLVTPARNEEQFIELTIKSVLAQTVKPLKWVIVSDGSTDRTDAIVKAYAASQPWIQLLRMPERQERHFGGKVLAFNTGYSGLGEAPYDLIGNMDADISFESDFFAFLLGKFASDPALGLAGTAFREGGSTYDYRYVSLNHVSGQCQLFRRQCLEAIEGYVPVEGGGVDVIAVITAQMKGWKTRTFPQKYFEHHRTMGTASGSALRAKFKDGQKDYALGGHPMWEALRWVHQMRSKPLVLGGCMILAGYLWSALRRTRRPVSIEFVDFRRRDQMQRLRRGVVAQFSRRGPPASQSSAP